MLDKPGGKRSRYNRPKNDLLFLALASTENLGKAANGIADDLVSKTIMAVRSAKVVVFPPAEQIVNTVVKVMTRKQEKDL